MIARELDPSEPHRPGGQELLRPLIDAAALASRSALLGAAIDRDYAGRVPVLIVVLQGALVFAADLMRRIQGHIELASIALSSYPMGTERSREPLLTSDLHVDIAGRDVIIIEDIVDTGHTLHLLLNHLQSRRPASLSVATCLNKPARREVDVPLRYVGFEVPPEFVVGYGLDCSGRYRNLPYVAVLAEGEAV
jgi:hypoxanthine phosphoribosyltransferase